MGWRGGSAESVTRGGGVCHRRRVGTHRGGPVQWEDHFVGSPSRGGVRWRRWCGGGGGVGRNAGGVWHVCSPTRALRVRGWRCAAIRTGALHLREWGCGERHWRYPRSRPPRRSGQAGADTGPRAGTAAGVRRLFSPRIPPPGSPPDDPTPPARPPSPRGVALGGRGWAPRLTWKRPCRSRAPPPPHSETLCPSRHVRSSAAAPPPPPNTLSWHTRHLTQRNWRGGGGPPLSFSGVGLPGLSRSPRRGVARPERGGGPRGAARGPWTQSCTRVPPNSLGTLSV